MRLTLILLFLSLFRINANTYSQNTKITLDVKNVTIEEVFDIIKEKTEFKIFFKNSDIDLNREISFKTKKHNLDHILAVVFKNSNISYKVVDKQIVLNKKSPTNVSKKTQIQNIIKGVVKDPSGQPLIGVSIVKKGTAIGVETDFDGMFSIEAKEGDILVFSSLGYKKQEVTIANQKTLSVVLKEDVEFLNEVIVVTGYDRVSKRTFTGASTSVDMDEIKIEGVTDASRMLEGRVAGVNIQNVSGTFGAAPKITIRGSSSVFGNNNPLYVIDGVVQEDIVSVDLNGLTSGNAETLISSSLAGINANDIKSIDLLKDASATSLYGARARNGVVVIVTKNGSRDTPLKINYSLVETVRDIPNYANYDILNSKETVGVYREIESKGYLDLPSVAQARYGGIYYLMADRINTYNPQTGSFLLANTQEAKNGFLQQYELANTDWFKTLFRRSLTQTHSL
ncbi:TonB-dependent receptor plug domain-containing protein, partial [Cellulophaga fucicola]|uniref:STN domain-containing protein n=1 Tax=Cellulophaga fucicola TaxID=76595 RepID=UPI003EBB61B8